MEYILCATLAEHLRVPLYNGERHSVAPPKGEGYGCPAYNSVEASEQFNNSCLSLTRPFEMKWLFLKQAKKEAGKCPPL